MTTGVDYILTTVVVKGGDKSEENATNIRFGMDSHGNTLVKSTLYI